MPRAATRIVEPGAITAIAAQAMRRPASAIRRRTSRRPHRLVWTTAQAHTATAPMHAPPARPRSGGASRVTGRIWIAMATV